MVAVRVLVCFMFSYMTMCSTILMILFMRSSLNLLASIGDIVSIVWHVRGINLITLIVNLVTSSQ